MQGIKLVSALVLVGALGACGGGDSLSPVEACNQEMETTCARIYECYTAAQLQAAGYPATESACVTSFESSQGCSAKTSDNFCETGNAVYHGEAVSGCIDQVNGLTCADIMAHASDLDTVAPKCAEVCVIPT
jgi:hypothetical protein